jgi:NADPH:quinone reductase-like Zn-dependent oxidoreductase
MIIKGQYNPKMRLPRIPWSQAGAALARMDEGSHFGKLVLTVG